VAHHPPVDYLGCPGLDVPFVSLAVMALPPISLIRDDWVYYTSDVVVVLATIKDSANGVR